MEVKSFEEGDLRCAIDCVFSGPEMMQVVLETMIQLPNPAAALEQDSPPPEFERAVAAELCRKAKEEVLRRAKNPDWKKLTNVIIFNEQAMKRDPKTDTVSLSLQVVFYPELVLPDYLAIDLPPYDTEPTEAEVQEMFDILVSPVKNVPTESPAAIGDCVCINYVAKFPDGLKLGAKHRIAALCRGDGVEQSLAGLQLDYAVEIVKVETPLPLDRDPRALRFGPTFDEVMCWQKKDCSLASISKLDDKTLFKMLREVALIAYDGGVNEAAWRRVYGGKPLPKTTKRTSRSGADLRGLPPSRNQGTERVAKKNAS
ncbi:MAG: hypothetical protein LBC42_02025 [Puniceicoccales bacterium]|nr:hypothetical protein [Puniceicoccales bacterium]